MASLLISTRFALSNLLTGISQGASSPVMITAAAAGGLSTMLGAIHAFGDPQLAAGLTRLALDEAYAASFAPTDSDAHGHGDEHGTGHGDEAHHDDAHIDSPEEAALKAYESLEARFASYEGGPLSLPPAPLAGLSEPGPGGRLPVIGPGGRRAADLYARPFPQTDARPRLGLMVTGLGLSPNLTQTAIDTLPGEVALAFSPYAENLQAWVDRARAADMKLWLEAPMEPFDYPRNDAGPHTLLVNADAAETTRRLDWVLARAAGYVGIINAFGARYTTDSRSMSRLMRSLDQRGLGFVHVHVAQRRRLEDIASSTGLAYANADEVLDPRAAGAGLDTPFLRLEARALQDGRALGAMPAGPAAIAELARWARTLDVKGYALAPVSLVMNERSLARRSSALERPSRPAPAPQFHHVQAGFGGGGDAGHGDAKDDHGGKDDDHGGGH